jgi:hypothetical protein
LDGCAGNGLLSAVDAAVDNIAGDGAAGRIGNGEAATSESEEKN